MPETLKTVSYHLADGPELEELTNSFIYAHFEKEAQDPVVFTADDGQTFTVRILGLQRDMERPMHVLFQGELVTKSGPPSPVLGFHPSHVCGWIDADIGMSGLIVLANSPVSLLLIESCEE